VQGRCADLFEFPPREAASAHFNLPHAICKPKQPYKTTPLPSRKPGRSAGSEPGPPTAKSDLSAQRGDGFGGRGSIF
jgi:hypothetical protein